MKRRLIALLICFLMIIPNVTLASSTPAGLYDNKDNEYEYAYFPVQTVTAAWRNSSGTWISGIFIK